MSGQLSCACDTSCNNHTTVHSGDLVILAVSTASDLTCTAVLASGSGDPMRLVFESFNTSSSSVLFIYDGPNDTSPLLTKLSGVYSWRGVQLESTGGMLCAAWCRLAL